MPELRDQVREEVARMARGGELAALLGPANASPVAQQVGNGIGIQNVRRGVLWVTSDATGNITVPQATAGFASLSTPLRGDMVLSGRPLLIVISGLWLAGAAGALFGSALLRGVEVTGKTRGMPGTYTEPASGVTGINGHWFVSAPAPGAATLEFVADAVTADGTIVVSAADYHLTLLALEL